MEHKQLTGSLFVYPSGMLCVCLHLPADLHTTHAHSPTEAIMALMRRHSFLPLTDGTHTLPQPPHVFLHLYGTFQGKMATFQLRLELHILLLMVTHAHITGGSFISVL